MKVSKIIYLKTEVSLGDIIDFEGMKITVTSELIKNNPVKFEIREDIPKYVKCTVDVEKYGCYDSAQFNYMYSVINGFITGDNKSNVCEQDSIESMTHFTPATHEEFQKQELLAEAVKNYPKGTKFKDVNPNPEKGIQIVTDYGFGCDESIIWGTHVGNTSYSSSCIYYCGNWAEIVSPILTTEDGVEIYQGDMCWYVTKYLISDSASRPSGNPELKYFSTKTLAEAYIESKKEWTLEDYERVLLTDKSPLYVELKSREPKLYWTKVLQLIADRLNGDWKPSYEYGNIKHCIYFCNTYQIASGCNGTGTNYGNIWFKNKKLAKKAIHIIGEENLNKIYLNN